MADSLNPFNTNRRRRLVRLITRLNVGGPSVHVQLLSKGMRRFGYDTVLVAGKLHEGEERMEFADAAFPTVECPYLQRSPNPLADIASIWWIYRLLRNARPQIVHTHQAKAGGLGRIAAWLAGVPVILHTYHGHTFHSYFSERRTRIHLRFERFLANRTNRLIAISPTLSDDICKRYFVAPETKVSVVRLGLDLEEFYGSESHRGFVRSRCGLDGDVPLFGIVGRLTGVKNHRLFLEAARRILAARPETRFVVIGDGELRVQLERIASELGLAEAVHFLGWMPRSPAIYADLNGLILTSYNEGTPVALIEGMASGRVCVATNVGGVADLISEGETGFLVRSGEAETIARRCIMILDTPEEARRIGDNARAASKRYEHGRLCTDMSALYDQLLEDHAAAKSLLTAHR
jgi:glycosyltransferase involved in cell wall biosynthesis